MCSRGELGPGALGEEGTGRRGQQEGWGRTHSWLVLCPELLERGQGTEGLSNQHGDFLRGVQPEAGYTNRGRAHNPSATTPGSQRPESCP